MYSGMTPLEMLMTSHLYHCFYCSRNRYKTHFYCLAVEASFYSDVVERLHLDPAAPVRFPPRAVRIFLHPVTFDGQYVGLCFGHQDGMSRNNSVVLSRFRDKSI